MLALIKTAGVAVLKTDKVEFKTRNIRNEDSYFIMVKKLICQETIIILLRELLPS